MWERKFLMAFPFEDFCQNDVLIKSCAASNSAHSGITERGVNGLWHIKCLNLLIYLFKNGFRGFSSIKGRFFQPCAIHFYSFSPSHSHDAVTIILHSHSEYGSKFLTSYNIIWAAKKCFIYSHFIGNSFFTSFYSHSYMNKKLCVWVNECVYKSATLSLWCYIEAMERVKKVIFVGDKVIFSWDLNGFLKI